MHKSLLVIAAMLVLIASASATEDPIFDIQAITATPLNPRVLKRIERDEVITEQVMFHSERDGDKDVEIFAYFSYPRNANGLPALIWNQGGLAQASPGPTEMGANRGYAALCIDFPQPGYRSTGGYPINTGLELGDDPRQAPIYHGAVALLKAVSFLEGRVEVDKDRIGMAGSSWGGFFTTLMAGIDRRLKVAAAQYGTGSLQLGNAWWDGASMNGRTPPSAATRERWSQTLDPAWRLADKKIPIAWFTGTNDEFYLMPCVMKTYEVAGGPKHLMLAPNWHHALPPKLSEDQLFAWLDLHLKRTTGFPKVSPIALAKSRAGCWVARWDFVGDVAAADLIVSYGPTGNWRGRHWHTLVAKIDGNHCAAEIPPSTLPCYASGSITIKSGIRCSTPLAVVGPALNPAAPAIVPDYDGCAEWGGFEEEHIAYLVRHNQSGQTRWIPQLSNDAKQGRQSAILNPGVTLLAPILSTATVPHRFVCYLKAAEPTEVKLQLAGEERTAHVENQWTELAIEFTPPNTLMGGIFASLTVPPEANVLVDAVSLHPAAASAAQ